jgi:hypothetical protein
MSEHGEKQPADVLQTKRLEIVDDEGKVRAVLGTILWGCRRPMPACIGSSGPVRYMHGSATAG